MAQRRRRADAQASLRPAAQLCAPRPASVTPACNHHPASPACPCSVAPSPALPTRTHHPRPLAHTQPPLKSCTLHPALTPPTTEPLFSSPCTRRCRHRRTKPGRLPSDFVPPGMRPSRHSGALPGTCAGFAGFPSALPLPCKSTLSAGKQGALQSSADGGSPDMVPACRRPARSAAAPAVSSAPFRLSRPPPPGSTRRVLAGRAACGR